MARWIAHTGNDMPANIADRAIDIRTADSFEISHSRGDYLSWRQGLGRDTIVAYRVR